MTREEQDKLWAELSEKKQSEYRDSYNSYLNSIKTETHASNYMWGILEGRVKILIDMFGEHNLKPALTYEDVASKLFKYGYCYYDYVDDEIVKDSAACEMPMACTSSKQVKKICAINKLLNVAKFINKNEDGSDWVPDFDDEDNEFYTLGIDPDDNSIKIIEVNINRIPTEIVYFRTEEIAQQAVQILGEDVVRTALTTDY